MTNRILTPVALLLLAAATAVSLAPSRATQVVAASASISVTPATQTVAPGATFTVSITQSSASATTGAEATISFDPSILQLRDVQPGPVYASGTVAFGGATDQAAQQAGELPSAAEAIATASQTGALVAATAFIQPGSGTAPPGDNVFLTLTMQAVAAGVSPISLSGETNSVGNPIPLQLLDDQYTAIEASGVDGQVIVDAGAPPPAATAPAAGAPTSAPGTTPSTGATSAATAAAGITPAATKTASTGVLGASKLPSLTSASFAISPATLKVAKEAEFTFAVTHQIDGAAGNAQAKVSFKRTLIEILKVEPGSGWKSDSKSLDAAVADANNSGELQVTLATDRANPPSTSGESTLVTVTARGRQGQEGTSDIKFVTTDITGSDGNSTAVKQSNGSVTVGSAGGGSGLLIVIGLIAAVVIAGGGGAAFWMRRAKAS